jgi:hypothetical protein
MGIIAIAPEIGVAIAVKQYLEAMSSKKHSWSMVHAFYTNMGGFAIHIPPVSNQEHPDKTPGSSLEKTKGYQMSQNESKKPEPDTEYILTMRHLGKCLLLAYDSAASRKA